MNSQNTMSSRKAPLLEMALAVILALAGASRSYATRDVLIQTVDGVIDVGHVEDTDLSGGALGDLVYGGSFLVPGGLPLFRSANPGFVSFATGELGMPAGAQGFPSLRNVNFDLLPMSIGQASANLMAWNGADLNGNGLDLADVAFAAPVGLQWSVLDGNSNTFIVNGADAIVPGGLIQRTSSDIDPFDGVDSGKIHKHLVLELNDVDGNPATSPSQGIYMIAWQMRSVGFTTSEPFLFIHRTPGIPEATLDVAVEWAEANYEMLTSPVVKGDFDGDGGVDGDDLLVWQRTLGSPAVPRGAGADGDVSGVIDAGDLATWRLAMSGGAVGVPEPAGIVLGLLVVLKLTTEARRARRGRRMIVI